MGDSRFSTIVQSLITSVAAMRKSKWADLLQRSCLHLDPNSVVAQRQIRSCSEAGRVDENEVPLLERRYLCWVHSKGESPQISMRQDQLSAATILN